MTISGFELASPTKNHVTRPLDHREFTQKDFTLARAATPASSFVSLSLSSAVKCTLSLYTSLSVLVECYQALFFPRARYHYYPYAGSGGTR